MPWLFALLAVASGAILALCGLLDAGAPVGLFLPGLFVMGGGCTLLGFEIWSWAVDIIVRLSP